MEKENIYKIFFYHQLQNITLTINKIKSLKMVIWIRKNHFKSFEFKSSIFSIKNSIFCLSSIIFAIL